MCVACREMRPKREMVRVVRTPAGAVILDPTGKANGRGAYVDPTPACVEEARRGKRLDAALEVAVPAEIYDELSRVQPRREKREPVRVRLRED